MSITRSDIEAAVNSVTGNPSVGVIHDIQPAIIDAIEALVSPPTPSASKTKNKPDSEQ